jgi:hypothetical protein
VGEGGRRPPATQGRNETRRNRTLADFFKGPEFALQRFWMGLNGPIGDMDRSSRIGAEAGTDWISRKEVVR